MRRIAQHIALLGLSLPLLACAARIEPAPAPPAAAQAPEGCSKAFPTEVSLLTLAPTRAPDTSPQKGQPFQFAHEIVVQADLTREAAWTDFTDGWSMLALAITSSGAKSLSLHLTQLELPPRTQIWLCSADRRSRQGPYREAVGGELWTPVVTGSRALLQIDVPTREKHRFRGTIASAFGGFR